MPKRHDKQFKEEAVNLVLEQERSAKKVAKEIGIHENTILGVKISCK